MDGLIGILVLIGIFSSLSKKKKQKAQKKVSRSWPIEPQSEPRQAPRPEKVPGQAKIPFTKEEWDNFLADIEEPKVKSVPRPAKPVKKENPAKPKKPVKTPAPVLLLDHDEPEGTVSTQGESAAEHAEHRQKVLAEEIRLREQQETLQELRHLNRRKLRQAVVMSEVLGKPVSLRPRSYR